MRTLKKEKWNIESFPYPAKNDLILICSILICSIIGSIVADAAFLFLCVLSILKKEYCIKALSLMTILVFINPAMVITGQSHSYLLRWLLIAITILVTIIRFSRKKKGKIAIWQVYFATFIGINLISSYFTSYYYTVSAFKLIIFMISFYTIYLMYKDTAYVNYESWFVGIFLVILLSSLIIWPFPFARKITGFSFQGIFSQPNAFGIYLVPFAAWLFGSALTVKSNRSKYIYGILLIITLTEMYFSFSRTSFLAFLGGVSIAIMISIAFNKQQFNLILKFAFATILILGALAWTIDTFIPNNEIVKTVNKFIFKGQGTENSRRGKEELFVSRQQIIARSLENFNQKPYFGNGFGVASQRDMFEAVKVGGIPIGATVEKGFIFTALLEETGIVGTFFFLLFFLNYCKNVIRAGGLKENMVLWSAFLISFGEMVFFSPGGLGSHVYLMMGLAKVMTIKKLKPKALVN